MQTITVLLIILAAIAALLLVLFQYYFKSKKGGKLYVFLSFLRFIAYFGILILIINPKFSKNSYAIEKAKLALVVDNSSSVFNSKESIVTVLKALSNNSKLADKFDIKTYSFASNLSESDSLSFRKKHTNITKALSSLNDVYRNVPGAVVLISDGNQTIGQDYGFYSQQLKLPVYPVSVGDTTQYEDLRIDQVNSNRYAFLKNKFPLEVNLTYVGDAAITTTLQVDLNNKSVYRKNIKLSGTDNAKTINILLDAESVGVKDIAITATPLSNEKNTINNVKKTAIEVIDEKTNIAIISSIEHPDIGALKKSIESNEQRTVHILKPTVGTKVLDDIDVFIMYQPNQSFATIFDFVKQKKASVLTITGANTNWNVINNTKRKYRVENGYPTQEIFGVLNPSFTKFDISDFDIESFPPLESNVGQIGVDNGETLLNMQILGQNQNKPLMFALDNENGKELVLFGEHIWKWRMQSYRNNQNFENFDKFIGKLMLYLASNKNKSRLNVEFQTIYEGSSDAKIRASYFDEAFIFDSNATLLLKLKSKDASIEQEIPMLLKNGYYEVDLSNLLPLEYNFTVTVKDENRSQSGNFSILDFDVEKQFLNTNVNKLSQLAKNTKGKVYFSDSYDELLQELLINEQFKPTQRSTKNVVSLIDFRTLLALIIATLSGEWFLRKYNGLI